MLALILALWMVGMPFAEAALTNDQYHAHIKQLLVAGVQAGDTDLVAMAVRYGQAGGDQREAAVRLLKDIYQAQVGIDPTTNPATKHAFKHWVENAVSGAGFEP